VFGRRKNQGDDAEVTSTALDSADESTDDSAGDAVAKAATASGPYDSEDAFPEAERLDLGGLRIPATAQMQVRIEADPATQTVVSATVLLGDGAVQLQAFAAPRSESLWSDVSTEIAASMKQSGAEPDEVEGPFGPELHGQVAVTGSDGKQQRVPAVFAGVDGPRWLLRMVFTGAAVSDDSVRASLDEVVRGVVIDRGSEPMPPRSLIPLSMPGQANDAWVAPTGADSAGG
jgi:hypothetical protein